ncbi:MAG: fibronectin type III domain-containing protein [Smithella sp.]
MLCFFLLMPIPARADYLVGGTQNYPLSVDPDLGASDTTVSTQNAVKTYINNYCAQANDFLITTQNIPALTNGFNLGQLSTGLIKITVSGGVAIPSIAVDGVDYLTVGSLLNTNSSINSLAALTYVSPSFVKMTGANTFAPDTTLYQTLYPFTITGTAGHTYNLDSLSTTSGCFAVGCTFTSAQWATFLSGQFLTAQTQADWNDITTTDAAYIKNKPTIPNMAAPGPIGGTTPSTIAGTTITGAAFATSSADGTHYVQPYNSTSNPTCNSAKTGALATSGTPPVLYICDGTNWDTLGTTVTVPSAPAVSASAGSGSITCSWSGITNATSYDCFAGTSSPPGTETTGCTSPWTISGLTNGTAEYCAVEACNSAGCSALSDIASGTPVATVTIPGAPTSVVATAGTDQNTVTWGAPTTGSTPTSYNLYWATADMGTSCKTAGTKVSGVTSPDVITSLTAGTEYFYEITAANSAGEGICSSEVNGTPTAALAAPGAPTSITATAGNAQITLTWSSPSSGGAVSQYNVGCSTTSGSETFSTYTNVTSPYTYTGLTNGTLYYCKVQAQNASGTALSSEVNATPNIFQQGGYSGTLTASSVGASGQGASGGTDWIMQNYSLTASTITKAKIENYYANAGGAGSSASSWIVFKVWRLSGGVYTLIGSSGHIAMQTTAGLQTYTFTGITCQTGDLLGFSLNAVGTGDSPYDGSVDTLTGSGTYYSENGDITSGTLAQSSMTSHVTYSNIQIQFWGD